MIIGANKNWSRTRKEFGPSSESAIVTEAGLGGVEANRAEESDEDFLSQPNPPARNLPSDHNLPHMVVETVLSTDHRCTCPCCAPVHVKAIRSELLQEVLGDRVPQVEEGSRQEVRTQFIQENWERMFFHEE